MSRNYPSLTKKFHSTAYDAIDSNLPNLSAVGKNIVITGGGTGIGAATALRFAQAGASTISLLGRRDLPLQSTKASLESMMHDVKVFTYSIDITSKDLVEAAFRIIHDCVGDIHVLINNAGYISTPVPIEDADDEDWWQSFEVNIKGAFLPTQAFLRSKAANATVIYVSSGLSHISAGLNTSSYSASKAGAVRFFAALQLEYPELRVVCLHPGMIETDMLRKSGHPEKGDDVSLPAATMVWLASPEAEFLKGRYIWANWDVQEMKSMEEEIVKSDLLTMRLAGWPFSQASAQEGSQA